MATLSALPVVSQPGPFEVTFSKSVQAGTFTVEVSGTISIDATARTLSGTVTILVKDGDTVIAERTIEFANAAAAPADASGAMVVERTVAIEEAGLTVHLAIDPVAQSVMVSVELIPGNAERRHA